MENKTIIICMVILVLVFAGIVISEEVFNSKLTTTRTIDISLTQEEKDIFTSINFDGFIFKEVYDIDGTCSYSWSYSDANDNIVKRSSRFNCEKMTELQKDTEQIKDFEIQLKGLALMYEKYVNIATKTGEISGVRLV